MAPFGLFETDDVYIRLKPELCKLEEWLQQNSLAFRKINFEIIGDSSHASEEEWKKHKTLPWSHVVKDAVWSTEQIDG